MEVLLNLQRNVCPPVTVNDTEHYKSFLTRLPNREKIKKNKTTSFNPLAWIGCGFQPNSCECEQNVTSTRCQIKKTSMKINSEIACKDLVRACTYGAIYCLNLLPLFVKTTVGTGKDTRILRGEDAVKHMYKTKVDEADEQATAAHIATIQ
eukprot:5116943-Amphidinium_carterae.1